MQPTLSNSELNQEILSRQEEIALGLFMAAQALRHRISAGPG